MELQKTILDEQISEIQGCESKTVDNVLHIGGILKNIKDGKTYKLKYGTFEECIESNFSFTRQYAYKMIEVFERYGENVKLFYKVKQFGIRGLILSLQVPDDYIEEAVEEISAVRKHSKDPEDVVRVVKRFSKQAGSAPRHSSSPEEHILKLRREAIGFKEKHQELLSGLYALKEAMNQWDQAAAKYPQLNSDRNEIRALAKEI